MPLEDAHILPPNEVEWIDHREKILFLQEIVFEHARYHSRIHKASMRSLASFIDLSLRQYGHESELSKSGSLMDAVRTDLTALLNGDQKGRAGCLKKTCRYRLLKAFQIPDDDTRFFGSIKEFKSIFDSDAYCLPKIEEEQVDHSDKFKFVIKWVDHGHFFNERNSASLLPYENSPDALNRPRLQISLEPISDTNLNYEVAFSEVRADIVCTNLGSVFFETTIGLENEPGEMGSLTVIAFGGGDWPSFKICSESADKTIEGVFSTPGPIGEFIQLQAGASYSLRMIAPQHSLRVNCKKPTSNRRREIMALAYRKYATHEFPDNITESRGIADGELLISFQRFQSTKVSSE